jgi:hypothetical protein
MTFDLEEKKEREREFTREVRFNSEERKLCRQKDKIDIISELSTN